MSWENLNLSERIEAAKAQQAQEIIAAQEAAIDAELAAELRRRQIENKLLADQLLDRRYEDFCTFAGKLGLLLAENEVEPNIVANTALMLGDAPILVKTRFEGWSLKTIDRSYVEVTGMSKGGDMELTRTITPVPGHVTITTSGNVIYYTAAALRSPAKGGPEEHRIKYRDRNESKLALTREHFTPDLIDQAASLIVRHDINPRQLGIKR